MSHFSTVSTSLPASNPRSGGQPTPDAVVSVSWASGHHHRPRAVVVVAGELDVATVGPLRAATLDLVLAADPRPDRRVELLLDWGSVTFLDSSAVHFLEDISAEGVRRGWTVQLRPPSAAAPAGLLRFAASQGWIPPHLGAEVARLAQPARVGADATA